MSAAVVLLTVAMAVAAPAPVTVPVLRAHMQDWNGRQVEVRGWTHNCDAPASQPCWISPYRAWRKGRERVRLVADARVRSRLAAAPVVHVALLGTVQAFDCPADDICLDGEDKIGVDAVAIIGGPSS